MNPQNVAFRQLKIGTFGVSTTISDQAIVTNPKMTQFRRKINGPFWGLYQVKCLCYSLFGPFWDPSCIRINAT